MTDYTAVAPPSNLPGGFDPSSAFADALQRARQIAAKINSPSGESNSSVGTKRPLEDSSGMDPSDNVAKKIAAAINDPIGAQLAAMHQHQRMGMPGGAVVTEEFRVPDKMVGLIIGRGGEQITRLQADSGCKIQMAADSGGHPDRPCSLTGTRQAVEKAKDLILQIVNRGGTAAALDSGPLPDGHSIIEMMIPGSKVGLVIGKGGETIKSLQERAGVKMVMIQDGPQQTGHEKPLRISGEPQKCEYARQLVLDLLTERELENMSRGFNRNQPNTNDYGSQQSSTQEVSVPRQAVGVVIGKGGEMIKKIQQDSGARVQFQQGTDDGPGDRLCYLTGSSDQIQQAQGMIHELISSVLARDQQNMGRGRGRGRGGGGGGGGGFDGRRQGEFGGPGGMNRNGPPMRGPNERMEVQYPVPAAKCGIVIGKGGETIRAINQQSGAHVELSRQPPPNPAEKVFIIRGAPNQIEHAKQLINEKIGMGPGPGYGMGPTGPGGPPPGSYPSSGQQPPPPPQAYAPQGWGNAYQHWQAQAAASGDPTKAAADANAAAWAAYYAQYYGAQATQQPAPPPQGQPGSQPSQASGQQPASAAQSGLPPGATGQTDYSAAWAEYYRSLGMFREAEMIEQQARAGQPGQANSTAPTQQQQGQQSAGSATSTPGTTSTQPAQAASTGSNQANQAQYQQYGQYGQYGQQPPYPYNYAAYSQQQYPPAPGTTQ